MHRSRNERGATMVEYALIVALVGALGVGALSAVGGGVSGGFNEATAGLAGSTGEVVETPEPEDTTTTSTTATTLPPAPTTTTTLQPCTGPPWGKGGKPKHC
jgi:Flp pilus assembly pilin Flp